jgi:hypothetical protein
MPLSLRLATAPSRAPAFVRISGRLAGAVFETDKQEMRQSTGASAGRKPARTMPRQAAEVVVLNGAASPSAAGDVPFRECVENVIDVTRRVT